MYDADGLMPDHQAGHHRVFAAQNVQVRPADGCQRHSNDGLADAGLGDGILRWRFGLDREKPLAFIVWIF